VQSLVSGLDRGESLFYLLYGRYMRLLSAIFLRMSRDAECFADLMAELELHLLADRCAALKKYNGRSAFSTWLSATAHNLFADKLPKIENLYAGDPQEVERADVRVEAGTKADTFDELRQALRMLPATEQRIVIMKELEGYSAAEIAHILTLRRQKEQPDKAKAVSVDNVYKIKQRAMEALAHILKVRFEPLAPVPYSKGDGTRFRIEEGEGYFCPIDKRYRLFLLAIDPRSINW